MCVCVDIQRKQEHLRCRYSTAELKWDLVKQKDLKRLEHIEGEDGQACAFFTCAFLVWSWSVLEGTIWDQMGPRSTLRYPEVPQSTKKYLKVARSTSKYPEVPKSTQKYQEVPQSAQKYLKVPKSTLKCPEVPQNTQKYLKGPRSTSKYPKVPQSSQKYLKVPKSTSKYPKVPKVPQST